ncbi:TraR/DksA C4-type zinc finger protein [Bosea sp. RAC05]|uniref:TraR/DksA C4-type zinc finger protein n=1 Tax=Bosea sp. RAC05 TaxID=1842539 RepID=UPI00083E4B89|nr:TraR/DksA C4-type zinc finger protein [Bosea sp. RAC05]AOG03066.1 prokaryotic dksA/traR C4-type zinc finger family protein [Bosea sp. RAC05]
MSEESDITLAIEREDNMRDRQIRRIQASVMDIGGPEVVDCEDCGDEIPEARRRAIPSTKRCISCQTRVERR